MKEYLDLMNDVLACGEDKTDRTGTGTYSVFGRQIRFNLANGFPLITTKKVHFKSVVHELIWFLSGNTNIKYLQDNGVRIWNEWADDKGDLGPVYGKQWVNWSSHDGTSINQIENLIQEIKTNPDSRRLIVTAWNVADIPKMKLAPCHMTMQFYVSSGKLSCQLYQRSGDLFLGVPFNIASYSLFTHMVAQVCCLQPGEFVHTFGDLHIYKNHIDQVREQLSREPKPLPVLKLNPTVKDIFKFTYEDIELAGYDPHPLIKGKVAV